MWCAVADTLKRLKPNALHCQDKSGVALCAQAALLCVSDGLGSCAMSHVGARLAVQHFLREKERFWACQSTAEAEAIFCQSVASFREYMQKVAAKKKCAASDFSSTLVLVLVTGDMCWGVRVGDGFAVVRQGSTFVSLFAEQSGALELTKTLLSQSFSYESVGKKGSVDFVLCSSDGLYDLTYDRVKAEPYQAFFRDFYQGLKASTHKKKYVRHVLRAALAQAPSDDTGVAIVLQN